MLARTVHTLPEGPHWRYEPKWDGYRALAGREGAVSLTSRSGRPLQSAFRDVAAALESALPEGTAVDGEIVRWSPQGRLDFAALQRRGHAGPQAARRLARSEPCHYIVFDLLRADGAEVVAAALDERRARLEELMRRSTQPALMLGWQTSAPGVARQWYDQMWRVGVEGLVVKDGRGRYRPGRRDWLKYKRRVTTEAIVGGVIGAPAKPRELIVGRRDSQTGALRVVGRTGELEPGRRGEVGALLRPSAGDHPWPERLPSRWGSAQEYARVVPEVVVEITPDAATASGRWRHRVGYVRARPDRQPADVPPDLAIEG
ncbi:ATP-dependent DNA ligase [Streptomonospora litoralis]|uniref:Putative ATP-dependent DNA ligase YkoU n=1 Tax=Streptomonospora litoralis TaxID=2498135 RepID=A0A4P6Q1Y6_9ACTN|nr:ATP-dependent DNA ligase [Streptomonospora litoralis]QBI54140.1 putative ATP-dependent DNA ligase YkoU [Streptomonospora litoralis]